MVKRNPFYALLKLTIASLILLLVATPIENITATAPLIPRPVARSTDYSWRIETKGPMVRSIFREGKGQLVKQVFGLTKEGVKDRGLCPAYHSCTLFTAFPAGDYRRNQSFVSLIQHECLDELTGSYLRLFKGI